MISILDRTRASGEDEERRLESILNVVRVSEHAAANSEDYWTVTLDQCLERVLITGADELLE